MKTPAISVFKDAPLWKPILNFARMSRARCVVLVLMIGGTAGLSAVPPIIYQNILHTATDSGDFLHLAAWLAGAVTVMGLSYLISFARDRTSARLTAQLTQRLQRRAFLVLITRKSNSPPAKGDLNALINQTAGVASFVFSGVPGSAATILGSTACLTVALYYDPVTTVIAVLVPTYLYKLASDRMAAITRNTRQDFHAGGEIQSFANQAIERLTEIKSANAEQNFYRRWRQIVAAAADHKFRLMLDLSLFTLAARAIGDLVTVSVIIVGATRIYYGAIDISELVAIQMLLVRAVMPLTTSGNLKSQYERSKATLMVLERASGMRETGATLMGKTTVLSAPVSVEDVSLAYAGGGLRALDGVSVSFPRTGVIAIVGRNGSGKSSLMNILNGTASDHCGKVIYDGVDMSGIRPRSIRRATATVSQNPIIFPGTLRDNLLHAATADVEQSDLEGVLRSTMLNTDLATLPEGLETVIQGFGEGLSGGQRQKVAIARALLSPCEVVILDEPTSALDAVAARQLMREIYDVYAKERLFLIVTHDLSIAEKADRVLVMRGGRIAAYDHHSSIAGVEKDYLDMFDSDEKG